MGFQKVEEVLTHVGGKVLVFGKQGTGKSTFVGTFPKINLVDTEDGQTYYIGKNKNILGVMRTTSANEVQETLDELNDEDMLKDFDTIVIDSGTKLYENMQSAAYSVAESRARKQRNKGMDIDLDDVNIFTRQFPYHKEHGKKIINDEYREEDFQTRIHQPTVGHGRLQRHGRDHGRTHSRQETAATVGIARQEASLADTHPRGARLPTQERILPSVRSARDGPRYPRAPHPHPDGRDTLRQTAERRGHHHHRERQQPHHSTLTPAHDIPVRPQPRRISRPATGRERRAIGPRRGAHARLASHGLQPRHLPLVRLQGEQPHTMVVPDGTVRHLPRGDPHQPLHGTTHPPAQGPVLR